MLPLARQARHLGRYRQIAHVLGHHGFGYVLDQLGLLELLSLPRRVFLRVPPPQPVGVAERLSQVLVELGPTFIKFGQLLSTRSDLLPADLITELNKLQDTVPPFSSDLAVEMIEAELGQSIDQLFREFTHAPLAAASLGQVHAAVLPNGKQVVVKVQRPDIANLINTDLAIISDLAELAQERTIFGTSYDLVELAWEFSATIRDELNYIREGSNAERFRRNFAHSNAVHIPTIYWDYTTHRILTTERIFGVKINDIAGLKAARIDRKRLARNSLQLIIEEVFQHGFFHADPHAGNFFAMPGAVIGAIDFGQVVSLDPETTRELLLLLMALINQDHDGVLRAMTHMGMLSRYHISPALRRDVQRFLDRFIGRPLSELSFRETGNDLIAISRRHGLYMPSPVAMLLKTLIMAEGIGLQIEPTLDVFTLARPYAQQAMATQFSPRTMARQFYGTSRDLAEVSLELPHQMGGILHQLSEGKLVVRTHEEETHRLAGALIGAANRLSVALVLAALIMGLGLLALAIILGDWNGTLPIMIAIGGSIVAFIIALVLLFALMRGRNG